MHVNSYLNRHFVTQFKCVNLQKDLYEKSFKYWVCMHKMKECNHNLYPVFKFFQTNTRHMNVLSLDMAICISLMCVEKNPPPPKKVPRTQHNTHIVHIPSSQLHCVQLHTTLHCAVAQHYFHTVMATYGTHEVVQLHRHI